MSQVATGIGIAVTGTVLAALFTGNISSTTWSADQAATFQTGVTVAGVAVTAVAAALVLLGMVRSRRPLIAPHSEQSTERSAISAYTLICGEPVHARTVASR